MLETIISSYRALGSFVGSLNDRGYFSRRSYVQAASTIEKTAGLAAFAQLPFDTARCGRDLCNVTLCDRASVKPALLSGLSLIGTACDAAKSLDTAHIVHLGRAVPGLGAVSDGVTLITEGSAISDQLQKFKKYEVRLQGKYRAYYTGKKRLGCLRLVKKVTACFLAFVGLVSLSVAGGALFGGCVVGATGVYLGLTLAEIVYTKIVTSKKLGIRRHDLYSI